MDKTTTVKTEAKTKGWFKFENDLANILPRLQLSGRQWQILFVVIRQTDGWSKDEDIIAISQFEDITGVNKRQIIRILNYLIVDRNILTKNKIKNKCAYGVNKNYTDWILTPVAALPVAALPVAALPVAVLPVAALPVAALPVAALPVAKSTSNSGNLATSSSGKVATHKRQKDTNTKDNILLLNILQKKKYCNEQFYKLLFDYSFWKNYPSLNDKKHDKDLVRGIIYKFDRLKLCLACCASKNYAKSELVGKGIGIKFPKNFIKNGWQNWIEPERSKTSEKEKLWGQNSITYVRPKRGTRVRKGEAGFVSLSDQLQTVMHSKKDKFKSEKQEAES